MNADIIIYDAWMSEMLEKKSFRIQAKAVDDFSGVQSHITTLKDEPVFLYAKVDVSDIQLIHSYEKAGFHLVETNTGFDKPISKEAEYRGNCILRFAEKIDEQGSVKVGTDSFRYTRFHVDPNIDNKVADRLKGEWVRNYYRGKRGDYMVVAEVDGEVAGFLQLIDKGNGVLLIDLISVLPKFQRLGIAGDMIKFAEEHCEGFDTIEVGTQIANIPSIRLYEKLGFRLQKASYVFHFHKG